MFFSTKQTCFFLTLKGLWVLMINGCLSRAKAEQTHYLVNKKQTKVFKTFWKGSCSIKTPDARVGYTWRGKIDTSQYCSKIY